MYRFYLENLLFPIAPESFFVQEKSLNKNINLIDETQFTSFSKKASSSFSFKVILPARKYHFAVFVDDIFKGPEVFLKAFESFKNDKKVLDFNVISDDLSKDLISKKVSLEDYNYSYFADGTGDVVLEIFLKEYVHHSTKIVSLDNNQGTTRPPSVSVGKGKYTIKTGDTLWSIARKFYGDEWQYKKIYLANKSLLDNIAYQRGYGCENGCWWIFPDTVITIT